MKRKKNKKKLTTQLGPNKLFKINIVLGCYFFFLALSRAEGLLEVFGRIPHHNNYLLCRQYSAYLHSYFFVSSLSLLYSKKFQEYALITGMQLLIHIPSTLIPDIR